MQPTRLGLHLRLGLVAVWLATHTPLERQRGSSGQSGSGEWAQLPQAPTKAKALGTSISFRDIFWRQV